MPGSYTVTLTDDRVRKKLIEEVRELIEAKEKDEIILEAADVLYFLTVLCQKKGISIDEVLMELRRRNRKGG